MLVEGFFWVMCPYSQWHNPEGDVLKGRREQYLSHLGQLPASYEVQALHGSHLRRTLHRLLHLPWTRKGFFLCTSLALEKEFMLVSTLDFHS